MGFLDILTCSCIAAPHVLYAFIWFQPHIWRKRFGSKAVSTFADVAAAFKVLQFSAVGLWFWVRRGSIGDLSLSAVPTLLWLPCLACVIFGQVLNVGIYKAIGKAGVYYGFKLGQPVPWHTGFPFNLGLKHPQYVGSVLTVWGLGGLLWHQAPAGFTSVLLFWTLVYLLTAVQEQYF